MWTNNYMYMIAIRNDWYEPCKIKIIVIEKKPKWKNKKFNLILYIYPKMEGGGKICFDLYHRKKEEELSNNIIWKDNIMKVYIKKIQLNHILYNFIK